MAEHPPGFSLGLALSQWPGAQKGLDTETLQAWQQQQAWQLPARWVGLMGQCAGLDSTTWRSRWSLPVAAGDWAPNALLFLEHTEQGVLALDTDPDEEGQWCAWWKDADRIQRVTSSWEDLAGILEAGPQSLETLLQTLGYPAMALDKSLLPFSTTLHEWLQSLDPAAPLMALTQDHQFLARSHSWIRYPLQPWFGVALEPNSTLA